MTAGDEDKGAHNNASSKVESSVALSGERTHRLPQSLHPNDTSSSGGSGAAAAEGGAAPSSSGNPEDGESDNILDRIRTLNQDQAVRNEDIFGPVDNRTLAVIGQHTITAINLSKKTFCNSAK